MYFWILCWGCLLRNANYDNYSCAYNYYSCANYNYILVSMFLWPNISKWMHMQRNTILFWILLRQCLSGIRTVFVYNHHNNYRGDNHNNGRM